MRNLTATLLGSAALSGLAVFAPADMGGPVPATSAQLQSYDANLPGYISPDAANFLPVDMQNNVLKSAPVVMAQLQPSAVAEGLQPLEHSDVTDADRLQSLDNRVAQLEYTVAELASRDNRANTILAWAEKVLTKYHDNVSDKPDVAATGLDGANA